MWLLLFPDYRKLLRFSHQAKDSVVVHFCAMILKHPVSYFHKMVRLGVRDAVETNFTPKNEPFFYDTLRIFLALVFFSENVFFFAETSNGIISEEEGDSSRAKKIYKFRSLSSTKRI